MNITRNKDSLTVQPSKVNSKTRNAFLAALTAAGLSQAAWAEREGVTPGHLSQVLSGKRESRSMVERIAAFAEKHRAKVAA